MGKFFGVIFLFGTFSVFSFGKHGWYYISGTAFAGDKTILKNSILLIKIGEDYERVTTNENGEYEIKVHWGFPCMRKPIHFIYQRHNNPRFISVSYSDKEIKIRNRWKKYARKDQYKSPGIPKRKDLKFA